MKINLAIIYNPRAGTQTKKNIASLLKEEFSLLEHELFVWGTSEDFSDIEKKILSGGFTHVIAAGGDGTINRVAQFVEENNLILGIIPLGSGNGLARSLNINLNLHEAIKQIKEGRLHKIDSARLNDRKFFCTAGVGFDAHVGKLFSSSTKRGFWTYFKISLHQLFSYKPQLYTIKYQRGEIYTTAFLITACNAGQWGNDIYIAPQAKIDDGLIELVIIKKFPFYSLPKLAYLLLRKKIHTSRYTEVLSGKEFTILRSGTNAAHFDGEPLELGNKLEIKIRESGLNVIC